MLLLMLLAVPFVGGGCAEPVGSGNFVSVPTVQITCTTAYCRNGLPARALVVYTTSSCANSQFGEKVGGSGNLSCSGAGCTGTITSFTSVNMSDGFYSVCVVLDFNGNYAGTAIVGDSTGGLENTHVNASTPTKTVTSFTDL